jgi:hypothetical protein
MVFWPESHASSTEPTESGSARRSAACRVPSASGRMEKGRSSGLAKAVSWSKKQATNRAEVDFMNLLFNGRMNTVLQSPIETAHSSSLVGKWIKKVYMKGYGMPSGEQN